MSIIVIKIGGGEGIDPTACAPDIAALVASGERVVLVHGGSHETNVLAEQLGHPTQTIVSPSGRPSRRTDRRTLEIFEMAYCGKVNKAVVERLRAEGVDAVGLSGIDGGLWTGRRKAAIRAVDEQGRTRIIRDDLSGRVEAVDHAFLRLLLDAGKTPVLTPPAVTAEGVAINVDADRAAAATAAALDADELLLLSNVPGLLADPSDPRSRLESVDTGSMHLAKEAAQGRMMNKVTAAEEAVLGGVARVVIGRAGEGGAIPAARAGAGTVFEHRQGATPCPAE